jgi:hypothetical protein
MAQQADPPEAVPTNQVTPRVVPRTTEFIFSF